MSRVATLSLCALLGALAGCSSGPARQPEIGEAFAGPATLKLRAQIDPDSGIAAVVHHGERLGILRRRRRFAKVRTPGGAEGWTNMRDLLAADQMAALRRLAEAAGHLPSQGAATVYGNLNVHIAPNRQAPSFYQIKPKEICQVVAHELSPRVPFEGESLFPAKPKKKPVRPDRTEPRQGNRISPPAPPEPPDDWLDLSKWPAAPPEPPEEEEPPRPVPTDDWNLVRLADGRAGWVLNRPLRMNIPDEVAQYCEGHRITSYFAMADVRDGDKLRHDWLWTTLSTQAVPYEFDSFRYFIWNTRHHRYETAYIEGGLKGYYPVRVHPVEAEFGKKRETFPGFTLLVEQDGVRYRKTYAYEYYRVRLVATERIETPPPRPPDSLANAAPAPPPDDKPADTGLAAKWKSLLHRWFGKN